MNLPSDELRSSLNFDVNFHKYINENLILPFDSKLITRIKNTNVPMLRDFYQIFEEGLNIGTCGLTARYLSYLFNDFILVENGICILLIGTKGSPNGEHAWLEIGEYIYDTTLMLKIQKDIAYLNSWYLPQKVTTSEELKKDELYVLQKKMANNKSDLKWKRNLIKQLKQNNFKCSDLGIY